MHGAGLRPTTYSEDTMEELLGWIALWLLLCLLSRGTTMTTILEFWRGEWWRWYLADGVPYALLKEPS